MGKVNEIGRKIPPELQIKSPNLGGGCESSTAFRRIALFS
jgi:hypothetical protein